MKKEIIINSTSYETRIAILEDNKLVELFVERPEHERMVGDIYKGKVSTVLPGMMAAFIDIGLEQNAFLHFSDIINSSDYFGTITGIESDDKKGIEIQDPFSFIREGKDILVQITKEPIGGKGARVTTDIALPGRFLVLMPYENHIGVSKKIASIKEKRRLKNIVKSIKPKNAGLIIRTVAEGKNENVLKKDLENLVKNWKKIERKITKLESPALVYKDMGMASSVIRDLFTSDIDRLIVDNRKLLKNIINYLKEASPGLLPKVELYKMKKPIFDEFNIENEIEKSLEKKIWLKRGGYIVIEQTEALVAIDVNSGKFIGKKDYEQNALKVNLEAVREIARQLRLRDIGGIIIIDLIDMSEEKNKKRVYEELKKEMRKDRAKYSILEISNFGLIEMTRQRIRPSLLFTFSDECPVCKGTGRIVSKETVAAKIERWIKRFKLVSKERKLKLLLHPDMKRYLTEGTINRLMKLMVRYWVRIYAEADPKLNIDEFRFLSINRNKDITNEYKTRNEN